MMYVILLGGPGAGKGTQAVGLSSALSAAHVASGDLFRRALGEGTPLGLEAKSYMDKGELVPDELTVRMVLERLQEPDCQRGAVLDGFPRTLAQAQALDTALDTLGKGIGAVLYIKVSEEELIRRLSGRWICRACQSPYHVVNSPPKSEGVCDRCGGELYQRDDDTEATSRRRVQVYKDQTAPLISYYQGQGSLIEIDGEQPIEQVGQQMADSLKVLSGRGASR